MRYQTHKARGVSARVREVKTLEMALELKHMSETGVFAGYASVFNVVDSQQDMVLRGAFADSLARGASNVKLLWQHRLDEPIGIITSLFEDERGLYLEGRLLLDVAQAREAYALLKAGAVTGLSIGYSPRRTRRDPDSGVRLLQAVDLVEVSLVTLPANADAQVTVVKAVGVKNVHTLPLVEALDRVLRVIT